jgi:hypothetical protein
MGLTRIPKPCLDCKNYNKEIQGIHTCFKVTEYGDFVTGKSQVTTEVVRCKDRRSKYIVPMPNGTFVYQYEEYLDCWTSAKKGMFT